MRLLFLLAAAGSFFFAYRASVEMRSASDDVPQDDFPVVKGFRAPGILAGVEPYYESKRDMCHKKLVRCFLFSIAFLVLFVLTFLDA